MSAASEGSGPTTKGVVSDRPSTSTPQEQKPATALEEDDEFEDFPIDGLSSSSFRLTYSWMSFVRS